jgi:hypothetical protein
VLNGTGEKYGHELHKLVAPLGPIGGSVASRISVAPIVRHVERGAVTKVLETRTT